MKRVAVIMGSAGDLDVMRGAIDILKKMDIPYTVRVLSAHRTPEAVREFAARAQADGFGVLIAGAGKAAHLAGTLAANTLLPVIGVPVKGTALDGLDALLSTVQMPAGIPVATVAIDGAANAALLAAQMLALSEAALAGRLEDHRAEMRKAALQKDAEIMAQFS